MSATPGRRGLATFALGALVLAAIALAASRDGGSPFKGCAVEWLRGSGAGVAGERILGPYADLAGRIADSLYEAVLPGARTSSLYWPLLVLTFAFALAFYRLRGGRGAKGADGRERPMRLGEYLLPRAIYAHPSARVDLGLYLVDRALLPVWLALGLGALAPGVERATIHAAELLFGASPGIEPTLGWRLGYGLAMLLVADAVFYFTHLFGHRTRIGWAFHKVHHSAEVLTPLTRYREHFVEGFLYSATSAVGLGFCGGAFAYLCKGRVTEITLMNLGVFFFLYALNGNFRHYHVSFRYPRALERWLQSPGMHHAHHSRLPQHWDTNLGLVTSVWDRCCGTLYLGDDREATPWGLPEADQCRFRTLRGNLLEPFREVAAILAGRSSARPSNPAGAAPAARPSDEADAK